VYAERYGPTMSRHLAASESDAKELQYMVGVLSELQKHWAVELAVRALLKLVSGEAQELLFERLLVDSSLRLNFEPSVQISLQIIMHRVSGAIEKEQCITCYTSGDPLR
jgi:hypothetical protein